MALVEVQKIKENVYYDDRTGNIYYTAIEDITDILNQNLEAQNSSNNGFTEERTMREICAIPPSVFHAFAKRTGYYGMNGKDKEKEIHKFLSEHQQYMTVDKLKHDTANQGHIVIK